jgi:hypothetical protein
MKIWSFFYDVDPAMKKATRLIPGRGETERRGVKVNDYEEFPILQEK